jgi:phosphatidylinositol glycan class B
MMPAGMATLSAETTHGGRRPAHSGRVGLRELFPGRFGAALLISAGVVHAVAVYMNGGFFGADEHFLIIEFAQHALGVARASQLAWEFNAKVRPALQPWIAAGVIQTAHGVGVMSPFVIAGVLRTMSAILGFGAALALCLRTLGDISSTRLRTVAVAAALLFWVAPFFHARFMSENWGGALGVLGLCLMLDVVDADPRRLPTGRAVACGLVWSAAFYSRFQVGFIIAGAGVWALVVRRARVSTLSVIAAAFIVGTGINELLDRALYGAWTFVPFNYLDFNVLQGGATTFGATPWWMPVVYLAGAFIPPFSLVVLAVFAVGMWHARRHVLVWTTVPFVLVHGLIAHKEPRFYLPLVYVAGPLFAVCVQSLPIQLRDRLAAALRTGIGRASLAVFTIINLLLLTATLMLPAHEMYRVDRWLWDRSSSTPIEIYTLGTSPYEIGGSENTFYRRDAVVLHPIASSDALRVALASPSRVPRYISYRGLTASSVVSEAGVSCPTVIQTFPEWFVRLVGADLLADAQLLTICGPI